jgi:hypothetical protein
MATNSVLARMAVIISANSAEFNRTLASTQKSLNNFTSSISKAAGFLGLAFSGQQIASFALEVSKLSGEAEGVRAAFERLPNSTKLMKDLKDATGGTVSELGLMKRAVQASNFDISLSALPRLLEFATLRAQQTGQSVDYLVDSIVTGIGRKSKLILDNLGISAVQLNEALGGASTAASSIGEVADAVGKIAEENLKNMAGFSDNAATKLQKLEASWENVKVAIGDAANGTGVLGGAMDLLGEQLDVLASRNIPNYLKALNLMAFGAYSAELAQLDLLQKQIQQGKELKKQEQIIREVDRAFKEFNGDIDAYGRAITTHIYRTELLAEFTKRLTEENKENLNTYAALKEQQDELNAQFETATNRNDLQELANIGNKIKAIQKQIDALDELRKAQKTAKDPLDGKLRFIPDLEAEGSLNPELRNDQAASDTLAFADALNKVATSASFAGGALIQLEGAQDGFNQSVKDFVDIGPMLSNVISSFSAAIGQAAVGAKKFGEAVGEALGGFMQQFGSALIAMGVGKIAFDTFQGPAMIVAGAALVALGAAVAATVNSRPNLSSKSSGGGGSSNRSTGNSFTKGGIEIQVGGEWKIRGADLVYIINRQTQLNGRTNG